MSLLSKIQSLISGANAVTGKSDATLTAAVQSLVDGYGQGEDPVINPLSVTENGTYTAPAGVDGYSPVTVNVQGGGGTEPYREDTIGANGRVTASVLHGYVDIPQNFFYNQNLARLPEGNFRDIGIGAFQNNAYMVFDSINVSGILYGQCFASTDPEPKVKIKCKAMGTPDPSSTSSRVFWNCQKRLTKVWLSKNIEHIYPASTNNYPLFSGCSKLTDIYTDAPSKPADWWEYFNYTSANVHVTVHYGVSEAEFDAL